MRKKSKGRLSRNCAIKPYVTIYVEGETEDIYFTAIRQLFRFSGPKIIQYKGSKRDLVALINRKRKARDENHSNNNIFILLDLDAYSQEDYNYICDEARRSNMRVFSSMQCFEIWLLAHYESISKGKLKKKEIERRIGKYWNHTYDKTHYLIGKIAEDYKIAIQNVQHIKELNYDSEYNFTNIDEMIMLIEKLCGNSI